MKIRMTISIDKGDETLKPFLDSNGGNLSLALRQMIGESDRGQMRMGIFLDTR
jgi:hypothetical protein